MRTYVCLPLVVFACAAPGFAQEIDFTGTWTTVYNQMKLVQVGDRVTGTYNFGGPVTLTGTVRGRTLTFTTANKRGSVSKGTFELLDDGDSFKATMDNGSQITTWTGKRPPKPIIYPAPGSEQVNRSGSYKVGDFVEIWHNGDGQFRWMVSRVLEISGGQYKVHYGGSQYNLLTVGAEKIHNAAREKAKGDNLARWDMLRKEIQPYLPILESFAHEHDAKWDGQSQLVPTTVAELKKALEDMTVVETLMSGKYAGMMAVNTGFDTTVREHPEAWLEIAKNRNKLARGFAKRAVQQRIEFDVKSLREIANQVGQQDGFGLKQVGLELVMGKREAVKARLVAPLKPLLELVGLSFSDVSLTEWDAAADMLVSTAKRVATTAKPAAHETNAGFAAQVKESWAKAWPERKIIKISFSRPGWYITTNALATPLYRHYGGMVQYKVAGFDYTIEQGFQRREDYQGNGKYTYRPAPYEPELRIVKG